MSSLIIIYLTSTMVACNFVLHFIFTLCLPYTVDLNASSVSELAGHLCYPVLSCGVSAG